MTGPSTRPNALARGYDRAVIQGAASREAARAGHPEVGFEHLLLGVLVNGGPGARLLMDAGVDLAGARAGIDALLAEDLALLGIDAALPAPSASPAEGAAMLPLAPRLQELVDDRPSAGGDRALLAALIGDGGGRVRRLLERLGVDADDLDLDVPECPAGGARPSAAGGFEAQGWENTLYDLEVPVPAERLWALLSDPERRGEWDTAGTPARHLGGGVVELALRHGSPVRESITRRVEGREVTWAREEGEGTAPRALKIVIEPLEGRARLHLSLGWPNALRGRLANRMVRWIARQQLRLHAQAIAQAAAS
ncbi:MULTISPECIES: Clp protease N-terminal domain-containing protein [unclassified Nocardiopsis]|uniref:Clp protease N-terminal domain-containing protein n=1 Tax=Nocardiopsis TaxID=2013 RepID=UPI00387B4513